MWVLESEDGVFDHKRLWLRPGRKFLFGRTAAEAGQYAISNKTISRKHLTIEIGSVKAGGGTNLDSRSEVVLEDLATKIGTLVDGVQIRSARYVLTGTHHQIKLGHYEKLFRISWVPVVLTFGLSGKEIRAGALNPYLKRLEPLDIKCTVEYVHGSTTHLVTKKRNTSKGLQALINGRYIVTDAFVGAIQEAAQPAGDPTDTVSKLESDYDSNWPDALQYLPPKGKEPTEKPDKAYAPDARRRHIFEGYTFIFYEPAQFDTLLAVITTGKGKALCHPVEAEVTAVEEFVRYVKNVAGEKGLGEFEDGSEGKGVVVVRFIPGTGAVEWYAQFVVDVSQCLDHRLIEQNEFLDAILSNDASALRKALEPESSGVVGPPPSEMTGPHSIILSSQAAPDTQAMGPPSSPATVPAPAPAPARRGRTRRAVTSRFRGFDDSPDPDPLPNAIYLPEVREASAPSHESQGMFVSQNEDVEADPSQSLPAARTRSSRKRPSPPIEIEEEDVMEALAPTASRFKKQKLAENAERRQRGDPTPPPVVPNEPKTQPAPKKIKKEIDVLEIARQQREKAEEMARAEREALQESLDGMDIDAIRNLAIVEEMEIRRAPAPARRPATGDESDRWDERWNGRKNFKKFRRQGATAAARRPLEKVIVALEEVKKKDFGIGDDYWLDKSSKESQRKADKGKGRATDSDMMDSDPQPPSARSESARPEHIVLDDDDDDDDDDDELPTQPRPSATSRLSSAPLSSSRSKTPSQPKRPAATSLEKTAPQKKARQTTLRKAPAVDDDSDEDDLKFRFRRNKK